MKIDWDSVEENIMNWFASKKINSGNPEELVQQEREKNKKLIGLKSEKKDVLDNQSILNRRGRKLTIAI
jgi:hypothetical protein